MSWHQEGKSIRLLADLGLVLTALIWGINFIVIKITLDSIPPLFYLGLRFLLAGGIICIFGWRQFTLRKADWLWAVTTGLLLFGGFALQTIGLQYTTPGLSAFLTVTYVLLVPAGEAVSMRHLPPVWLIGGALAVVTGIGFLSLNGNTAGLKTWGMGELLTVLCAISFSLHILVLDKAAKRINPIPLTGIQMLVVGLLSLGLALPNEDFPARITFVGWTAIAYGALFGSIGAYFIQTWAQRRTPPSHTGILLSLEAVFALAFSLLLGMETLGWLRFIGFGLVLLGIIVTERSQFIHVTEPHSE
ncbi:MAG: DMT family transporter [Desulfitobacteriaceae bacterium]